MPIQRSRWSSSDGLWHPFLGGGEPFSPTGSPPPPPENVSPSAAFTVSPNGLTCAFDASGSFDPDGSIVSYAWAFGDGTSGAGVTATHTYPSSGTRSVVLTVTDDDGATGTATRSVSTGPTNSAPSASFTASASLMSVSVNAGASFDPDGSIASYVWSWGDGSAAGSGAATSHTYAVPGTYTISLTVTDDAGATATATRMVTASAPPPTGSFVDNVTEPQIVGRRRSDGTIATVSNVGLGIWGTARAISQLTRVAGNLTVQSGQTVQDLDVAGRVLLASGASGTIIIQNNRVEGETVTNQGTANLINTSPAGVMVLLRGNEVGSARTAGVYRNGIGTRNFDAYRNYVHHVVDGARMNTGAGTHADGRAKARCNWIGDLLAISPDPEHSSSDNRTHCDGVQIESGFNYEISGNTFYGYASTDGTSNVLFVKSDGSGGYVRATSGESGAIAHPQTSQGVVISTYYARQVLIHHNWFFGWEFQIHVTGSAEANSTGSIYSNKHERRSGQTVGPWFNNAYIWLNAPASGIVVGSGGANTFMDDGATVSPHYA